MALINLETDSFSAAQVQSKLWMIQRLEQVVMDEMPTDASNGYKILILAGWYGITNFLLRARSRMPVEYVHSVDKDPDTKKVADSVNNLWEWRNGEFKSFIADINDFDYTNQEYHIVINTSVEHLASDEWYYNIPKGTLVVLQASNLEDDDHVNKINNARELIEKYPMSELIYEGIKLFSFENKEFYRSMIIGIK